VDRLYRVLFARSPSDAEKMMARDYLSPSPTPEQWARYVHALLVTNEFVFVD
jgi:hypothetical protein